MLKFERKIGEWIEQNIYMISVIAVTIIGVLIRYALRDFESADYQGFLSIWYEQIRQGGGIRALNMQVGNYNFLYQLLIALLTYIPIEPLYAYKILSCIFDFLLAGVIVELVRTLNGRKVDLFIVYTIVLMSPQIFLNSAAWAQCDSIYVFFVSMSLLAFIKDKPIVAMIMYGFAFALKLQAVFFLPFCLFIYLVRKKFSFMAFGCIPVVMIVTSIPALIAGRNVKELYWVYQKQVVQYKSVQMNYPSFWVILNNSQNETNWEAFKTMAVAVTIGVLGVMMALIIINKVHLSHKNILYFAFMFVYAIVLFLPAMHERYGYMYEVLAIAIVGVNKKTTLLLAILTYISCCTYGCYLYGTEINIGLLSVINIVTFFMYLYVLGHDMNSEEQQEA